MAGGTSTEEPDITQQNIAGGATIVLPRRDLPQLRFIGIFFLCFGAVFAVGTPAAMLSIGDIPVLFSIPFALVGVLMVAVGLYFRFGRSEIRVDRGTLYAVERAGPFRWRRKRPLTGLKRLQIRRSEIHVNGQRLDGYGHLIGEFENGRDFYMALVYQNDVLQQTARDFAPYLGLENGASGEAPVAEIESPRQALKRRTIGALQEQPKTSQAILERNDVGLMLTLPPVGLLKGSKGLFIFGVVWTGFTAVMTVALVFGGVATDGDGPLGLLFLIPFWIIGGVLLAIAINMGRRRALIGVIHDKLAIKRTNLFGTKTHEWTTDAIEKIDVEPSSMRVNNVPVPQLAIHAGGERLGLWTGRDVQELRWITAVLNEALGLYEDED